MSSINNIILDGTTYSIGGSGSGLTSDVKAALLECFENVAWIGNDGQDYYDALEAALYPPANLTSISAVYTQSGAVYATDTLDSLKTDLVVTAHYEDNTSETVTTYTLSGTLVEGTTSTITVTYSGKTTTFTVEVYATYMDVTATFNVASTIITDGVASGNVSWTATDYVSCPNAYAKVKITNTIGSNIQGRGAWYDSTKTFIRNFASLAITSGSTLTETVPNNAAYFRLCSNNDTIKANATTNPVSLTARFTDD